MQKNVAIQLRIGNASGRNFLAGILKRIKDTDDCTIRIASDADDFRRLSASAMALIADSSADAATTIVFFITPYFVRLPTTRAMAVPRCAIEQ